MATATVMQVRVALEKHAGTFIKLQHFTWQRNVLCGAGLAYAAANDKYWHMPIAYLVPSIYAGYQAFKGRDQVRDFIIGRTANEQQPISSGQTP